MKACEECGVIYATEVSVIPFELDVEAAKVHYVFDGYGDAELVSDDSFRANLNVPRHNPQDNWESSVNNDQTFEAIMFNRLCI